MEFWPLLYGYGLLQVIGWPFYLFPLFNSKRRAFWKKRLVPPALPEGRPVLWVHALSVGEIQAALALIKALKKGCPHLFILLTVTTRGGFECAQRSKAFDALWFSPVDLLWVVKNFIQKIRPQAFVLVETDLWPGLVWQLEKAKVPLFFANAALSSRALKRSKYFRPLARRLYQPFSFIGAASRGDQSRLQELLPQQKIHFLGNLKFDLPPPSEAEAAALQRELLPHLSPPIIVCGSTHPGEEELWLQTFSLLGEGSLVLCPRNPERAGEVYTLAQGQGFTVSLRSHPRPCQVLVVDTLGELRLLYSLADVAFVGGSLVPIGGHNLLEPLLWRKPVLFGPYVESIADLAQEIERSQAGLSLPTSPPEMLQAVKEVLSEREEFVRRGEKVVRAHQGAAQRYTLEIKKVLRGKVK